MGFKCSACNSTKKYRNCVKLLKNSLLKKFKQKYPEKPTGPYICVNCSIKLPLINSVQKLSSNRNERQDMKQQPSTPRATVDSKTPHSASAPFRTAGDEYFENVKRFYAATDCRDKKYWILINTPPSWSEEKLMEIFQCSRFMAQMAKLMQRKKDSPDPESDSD